MLSDQCPDTSEMAHQLENGQLDFRLPIFIFCIVSVKIAWLRMMLVVLCCRIFGKENGKLCSPFRYAYAL